ncbi:site-specific recombinase XerD [Mycobacteroides abscessus subsp. abscessus]|uniref:tyrosine-type recombinase/integrase n=1 Tax=Mycobacteroides abscessus TaxID=36809 RepID=UPI00092B359A|nr:site-specific integrase [Mycobacteroides abscessus]SHT00491.1 site-specific recombinase XerD [Mycobacteroides abscessus subsp. abscessus]SHT24592.1 site-specific recombinase XerD [Mycobacteroides abscessus subsp. abscessus]SHT62128.1 site-specific recombinase XerD [Mycobacteroides abscessus subsp. abscessus]SHX77853.1 site-specific recombinase XerD [Mycobacteroides abscessus subsp. abscessus]SIB42562.1 site-specific recombinase XerD [Mycobacteroides abscessus subsp. abscessus]
MARKKPEPRSTRRSFGRLRQFRSGRWKASYTGPDGKLYEAPNTFAAKIDAEAWLTDRRREIDRELWSPPSTADQKKAAATRKKAAAVRFDDYARRWLETRTVKGRPLKPRTVDHYRAMLDDHLLPTFGNKPVRDITMEAVDRWYAKTLTDKPTMRAHAYSLLRTILETARTRDRIIDTNPCLIRGAGSTTRKIKPKPATLDQLATLTAEMPERYRLMVPLAAWCALRFGELVELRRGDIELTERTERDEDGNDVVIREGVLKIRRGAVRTDDGWVVGDPKSEAGARDVAIPPHVVPAVKAHLASQHVGAKADALLFAAQSGGHLQPSTLYRHFYKARTAAGREDLRWHDLRHSGAVLAAQTGATLAELMARLGHSTPAAAMRYQHAAQGRDQVIAAALSAMVTAKYPAAVEFSPPE